jgi:hypothetical protein
MVVLWLLSLAPAPARAVGPDLIIDRDRLLFSWQVVEQTFAAGDCEVLDGCVAAPGTRSILRFGTESANIGDEDLVLGDPATNPLYQFDVCRDRHIYHYHTHYTLLAPGGQVMAETFKPGVCMLDNFRYLDEPWVPTTPTYTCINQGLTRGWSDLYQRTFSCQWVDVTDLPDGAYTLRAEINPLGLLPEVDLTNNVEEIPVFVGDPSGISHRPDGSVIPGTLMAARGEGASVRVSYDTSYCPASDYHLYYGLLNPLPTYTYDGAFCNLGTDGEELLPVPDPPPGGLAWFVIVGAEGTIEGGHGFDSGGTARPLNGAGFCSVTTTQPFLGCVP